MQCRSFAQIAAAFTATPLAGCSPIVVQFTDQSTGNPAQWKWDLGNGAISFLQNPSTTYFNPGAYTIKLVVRNGPNADSVIKTQYIHVFAAPVINFSASDTTGCFPFPVQFTDMSTLGNATVTSLLWDFGDGTTSDQPNPLHTYISAGNFTVTLKITSSNGCTSIRSRPQYIDVSNGVVAGFTNTSPAQCSVPVTINFTNTSTGPGSLDYTWDFGDGSGSNIANPVHTYSSPGSYTVTLVTESSQGCRDSVVKLNLISIGTITSQFDSPDNVCVGQAFTITNTTAPAPTSCYWDFGDGTNSTEINPVKTYTTAGVFTIKLVNTFSGCKDTITKTVVAGAGPTADFIANQTQHCTVPFTVNFANHSTGGNSYSWNFGDGGSSTETDPQHTYAVAGTYTVTLIAINGTGCTDTLVKPDYIRIKEPSVTLDNLPKRGCIPLSVSPISTINSPEPVTNYSWNFGDGSIGTGPTPGHVYTTAGTYTISLTITTASGCTVTAVVDSAVKAGNKPHVAFTVDPPDACAQHPIQFTDNTTGNPDQWLWIFGDGITSTEQNPVHTYEEVGVIPVTLIAWNNGCADTLTLNNILTIRPPVASFVVSPNCTDKYKVDFIDQSLGALSWTWLFGDGTSSTLQFPSHTYAAPGSYWPTLTVKNGNCEYSTYREVLIIDEKALFTADNNTACKNTTIHFTAVNINAGNIGGWLWDFGDGSTSSDPSAASHTYTTSGNYTVTLTITDLHGCTDAHNLPITIHGPQAAFSPSVSSTCIGSGPVLFVDASVSDGSHPLAKWIWNYGDGTIDSLSAPPYLHTYTTGGDFAVTLTVVDDAGCRDSLRKDAAVGIGQPHAAFHSNDSLSCTDKPVSFTNASTGRDLQYVWNFGDGSVSSSVNPVHYYTAIGTYTVSLLVTDRFGCRDSISRNAFINISYPKAGFTLSDSFSTCPPLAVAFTSSAQNYSSLEWDFGDGNNSTLANPSHVYVYPGIYTARLVAIGPGGCRDSLSKQIEVRGPRGSFTYAPLSGCKPLTVSFTATTIDRISFLWDFSDGTTVATTDSVLSHTYTFPGEYVPKMILEDITGCRVPIPGSDTITVVGVTTDFRISQSGLCDSGYVNFTDATISNALIVSWLWDFGDGGTSTEQHPVHHYTSPGTYTVSLHVTTEPGCVDSKTMIDTIKIFPSPVIAILGDSVACLPGQFNFSGQVISGTIQNWWWNLGNGIISLLTNPPVQMYSTAGAFTIISVATDSHGCRDSVLKTINIYPLPNTNAGPDAIVCLGNSVTLQASGAATYSWDGSPGLSCTNCPDPLVSPTDPTTYVVNGISEHGCSRKDSVLIRVQKPFVLQVSPGDTICLGESVRLLGSGADQYAWSPSEGLDNVNTASPRASPGTSTVYTLIAQDSLHCFADTATVAIKVYPIPTVEAGQDETIVVGDNVQLHATASADVISWRWRPGTNLSCSNCPDPVAAPKQTTKYSLEVRNEGGCMARDDLTIAVVCNKGELFIPNTFSPNGDGMNDRFYPRAKGTFIVRSLRVFNRWGELVFQNLNFSPNDPSAGWDGKFKGKVLSPAVYVYICEIQCENNETLMYTGDVTLIQ